jgi:hypothetical protein
VFCSVKNAVPSHHASQDWQISFYCFLFRGLLAMLNHPPVSKEKQYKIVHPISKEKAMLHL